MTTQLVLFVGALALLAQLVISFVRWVRSPLRSVPGPLLARFTNLWYLQRVKQGRFEEVNIALHKKHGSVVRYGPNRYSIDDVEASKIIYGHGTQFAKSSWYSAWQTNEHAWNVFSDRSIKRHAHNRRYYSNAYSMTSLVHYEPYINECSALFSQRLTEFSQAGSTVEIGHWLQCFAFDTIAFMTYGKRIGFLDCGEDIENIIRNLEKDQGRASLYDIYPLANTHIAPLLSKLSISSDSDRKNALMDFAARRVTEERAVAKPVIESKNDVDGAPAGETFLTKFLAKHSEDPEGFTNWHLLVGCASNMLAGSDTTGISLSAILYYLLKNPNTVMKLREEISEFTSRGELSNAPEFKQTQQMPYLQAVIKEALRLHPATGLPLERVVPEGGATISGRFFPEGTIVGINTWVQHRNKAVFGQDADHFRPERWLTDDEQKLSVMNRNWIPFGMGSRTCLGKNISILEISKLIPRIIRDFDFKLEGSAASPGESWKTRNAWFVKPQNFYVRVEPRKTRADQA
ncbi:Pisatin demethylase 2 [Colletotrichum chlorophyti]|uniref:Pisatin demethylase 2 n=1 Tax=Colletotrichum chlorophyti TaxID=708187 RepID=A0A1Q8S886_9PEZI|nr:Pisatin demethylase 2 [Colletotrichum chlorophyti]